MRNRAKCRLCGDIIESFHRHDFVQCSCKEISVDGGLDYFRCASRDWHNFLRVDDDENEIAVTFFEQEKTESQEEPKPHPLEIPESNEAAILPSPIDSKEDLIMLVNEMIGNIERLPQNAQSMPLNHYDMMSLLLLFKKFLETK